MADAQTLTVTGVLKIEIPDPATSLTLTFEPSADGDSWDADRLTAALQERGVREGYTSAALDEFLETAAKTKGSPTSKELLTGVPPKQPTADTVTWDDAPEEPEEYTVVKESVLADEPAPEIYREVKEKIEKQKEVEKKGKLPFGQPKKEVVTVTETITKKERVYIDPKVLQSYYVDADRVLGEFTPRENGVPGKDIYGRAIPVKKLAEPGFYTGSHIQKSGDKLAATVAGFVRIGKNWVDLVPFEPHRWEVELSRDKATCYLVLTPGHPKAQTPDAIEVRKAAIDLPYAEESLIEEEDLVNLIRGQIETGEAARLPITLSRDSSFDIFVTDDKLQAYLNVHKGKGRAKPLNLKEVGAAIKESGLVGLDFKKISTDMKKFFEGPEFDLTSYLLSEGTPPTPGPDRHAEYAPQFYDEKKTAEAKKSLTDTAGIDSFEVFPIDAITQIAPVEAEQLVCTVDPPSPGEPGRDVYGTVLPAAEGKAPQIELHENLVEKGQIIATIVGGILDYGEIEGVVHLRVRPHEDASIFVSTSEDRMEARLSLAEGTGTGRRLDRESIDEALTQAGIVHGLQEDRIAKALEAAKTGTPVSEIIVATGTQPVDQSANQIEFLVDTEGDSGVRIRKDGSADYKTRKAITTVTEGQELCRILPSQQEPIDGTDVTGKTISAKQKSGLDLELGENVTRTEKEDGTVVITANTDGELLYDKQKIDIRTAHTIKGDVDMKVGNIKFPGPITIGGTVRSGFYVIAAGDIKIAGGVEAALLSADGDIMIKQGVKGAGKAVLRSKRSILSPFVELATLLSVGDVTLKSSIVRSRIKCNGKIVFQGDKGRIVGGRIRARHGMEVLSIGSPRGVKTHVSFGQDYLIADLIEKEEKEIEKVKRRITSVDLSMRKLEKADSEDENLNKLRKEKVQLLKLMEKRGLRLFTLRERFEEHFPSKVIIKGDVHVGTVFESHGRTYEITRPRKAIAVEFNAETGNIDVNELTNGSEAE